MTEQEAVKHAIGILSHCGWKERLPGVMVREDDLPPGAKVASFEMTPSIALAIIHGGEAFDTYKYNDPYTELT